MNFYQETAQGYNELHGQEQEEKVQIIKEQLQVKKSDLLLDVGCGTGISSQFDCVVVGIDPTFELLQQNPNSCIQAVGENIPFKDHSFDIVVSITSLHNFSDISKGISEISRVGKKDFAFSILKKSKKLDEIEALLEKEFLLKKIVPTRHDIIFFCLKKK